MKPLWNYLKKKIKNHKAAKIVFLAANMVLFGMAGWLLWCVVRLFALDSWMWMSCFIGYGVVIVGYMGGILYLLLFGEGMEDMGRE